MDYFWGVWNGRFWICVVWILFCLDCFVVALPLPRNDEKGVDYFDSGICPNLAMTD